MEKLKISNSKKKKRKQKQAFLDNIKSKYILKILFCHLNEKKQLEIIIYNNKSRKRLNINIDRYKKYSEIYSSIEIEIKPVNNEYGKFINMNENDKKYYHIYFNGNKEEIKRNYLKKK